MDTNSPITALLKHKGGQVWSVPADMTVLDAIREMAARNVGALLVMDGTRLAGIVSERDYTRKVILHGKASRDTLVREIMTSPPITVPPAHTVGQCMRVMTENRTRHLPVVEGDQILGVVSIGDLVNWTISAQELEIRQLRGYITGEYSV